MEEVLNDIQDDPGLLKEMLADQEQASELYRPTNYWSVYARKFLPELETRGLHRFRSRRGSVLESFGATDLAPVPFADRAFQKAIPGAVRTAILQAVGRSSWYRCRRQRAFEQVLDDADALGRQWGAKPLSDFSGSLLGCPEDYYEVRSKYYTYMTVYYYLQYAWCCRYVDFESIATFVELGSGAGKLVELLKFFYPRLTFYLFDIAPQLYVCEQYLKGVFPGRVVSYRDAKRLQRLVPDEHAGMIVILGACQFPLLAGCSMDLFWNSASLQEMEPGIAENYLRYVDMSCRHVYLRELFDGQVRARVPGGHGVIEPTRFIHYVNALKSHKLIEVKRSPGLLWCSNELINYADSFWML